MNDLHCVLGDVMFAGVQLFNELLDVLDDRWADIVLDAGGLRLDRSCNTSGGGTRGSR